jgi:hypothetical protein
VPTRHGGKRRQHVDRINHLPWPGAVDRGSRHPNRHERHFGPLPTVQDGYSAITAAYESLTAWSKTAPRRAGASRGIGLAIGLRAARDGANVTIVAKTASAHPKLAGTIHTAAAEIESVGGKALPLVVDGHEPIYDRDGGRVLS